MNKKNIKILLVDDEPDILEIVGYNLSNEGYQIITAENGVEAVKKAKKELREVKEEVKEAKIREQLYLERLDNWAEKNQALHREISGMTMDDVARKQRAKAEYKEKYAKDIEIAETFDKQAQVKLNSTLNGNTS